MFNVYPSANKAMWYVYDDRGYICKVCSTERKANYKKELLSREGK